MVELRPELLIMPLLQEPLLRFLLELHRAEVIRLEGGMLGGTGILMSTFSGVTVDLDPYRRICTTSHRLETANGTT